MGRNLQINEGIPPDSFNNAYAMTLAGSSKPLETANPHSRYYPMYRCSPVAWSFERIR